jgi:hypothetical protein
MGWAGKFIIISFRFLLNKSDSQGQPGPGCLLDIPRRPCQQAGADAGRGLRGGRSGRGQEAVAAGSGQGIGGRARGGGMPVSDDAGGSGEEGGRGVRVDGRG